jgi:crotonobetainyl-CoA:carnitine CoA-transferase CaiB-like acyl-CoA transferase
MYPLLNGVRVLELALLAPDLVGMHLADLGAEVIKVEPPGAGDYLREIGARKLAGINLMHLRWNRGKKSIALDLKRPEGQGLLQRLASHCDVVIDGLRAGAAARCGADYETLRVVNPRIVYCSISGAGQTGPYSRLATHGVAYDAFAALAPPSIHADGSPRIPPHTQVGMHAAPLYAAMVVCAALVESARTGRGRHVEVAELDAAASWHAERIDAALNQVASDAPNMSDAVRYQYYRTADDRVLIFQASERKFWRNFCAAVGRMDLFEARPGAPFGDHARGDEELRRELTRIFRARTRDQWIELFIAHDVPGGPVHSADELPDDPHFRARELLFEQDHPLAGRLRLFATPVKVPGERFSATAAPDVGQHTEEVLGRVLGLASAAIEALRRSGVISGP